ncbi:uncharacterized protein [Diadema antillarum]|uniref:uncharacterized protein n=1 Tax=Diadema antillarum TaxID=105358 RepID=UPI003A867022
MAQSSELNVLTRARFGSTRNGHRGEKVVAKALVVMGVGMIFLLVYAAVPLAPLLITGLSIVLFGLTVLILGRLIYCVRNSSSQDAGGPPGNAPRTSRPRQRHVSESSTTVSQRQMQTRTETNSSSMLEGDIWTSGLSLMMPYPPRDPPPVYSATPVDFETDVDSQHTREDPDDTVSELPVLFPIYSRRRTLSTPPLPSYEEVIELDRLSGMDTMSSSMPTLSSPLSSVSTSTITTSTADIISRLESAVSSSTDTCGGETNVLLYCPRVQALPSNTQVENNS